MPEFTFILDSFGLKGISPKVFLPGAPLEKTLPEYPNQEGEASLDPVGTSSLGTPVFSNLVIEAGSYTQDGVVIHYEEIRLDAVLMDVTKPRNIVKTKVVGRPGTIKEFISDGDYRVGIRGVLIGPNGNMPPEEDIRRLVEISKVPDRIAVLSTFLDYFEISHIVIDNARIFQRTGFQNQVGFELHCSSDLPIELLLNEEG